MGISLNFEKFEKSLLNNLDVLNETIDCLIEDEHYLMAYKNVIVLREWERFYVKVGLKHKDYTGFYAYLNHWLGLDTGKGIDEFKDYIGRTRRLR